MKGEAACLAQPTHQHVAGARGYGQQRVIAPLAGVAMVACALLGSIAPTRWTQSMRSRLEIQVRKSWSTSQSVHLSSLLAAWQALMIAW